MRKTVIRTTVEQILEEGVVSCDVPLLIRLLEYAREDAHADTDLHYLVKNMIKASEDGSVLTMDHYPALLPTPTKVNNTGTSVVMAMSTPSE